MEATDKAAERHEQGPAARQTPFEQAINSPQPAIHTGRKFCSTFFTNGVLHLIPAFQCGKLRPSFDIIGQFRQRRNRTSMRRAQPVRREAMQRTKESVHRFYTTNAFIARPRRFSDGPS